jgi:hypothetical protein
LKNLFILTFLGLIIPASLFASNTGDSLNSEKSNHLIKQDYLGLNDVYETPYYSLIGKKPGPVMILDGGIHGDEIAAFMCCDSILHYINVLAGTLIIIPRVNIQACMQNVRELNIDFNHAFPGDLKSDTYEFRLAYEFMWLVDSVKPDLIINLHEAHTKYNANSKFDSDMAYGQIVISCLQPFEPFMLKAVDDMNTKITVDDYKFHAHYYSFREYSSLDNFVSKFKISSYTIETWRGFNIETRVKAQIIASLQFMEELGLKFEYPDVKF